MTILIKDYKSVGNYIIELIWLNMLQIKIMLNIDVKGPIGMLMVDWVQKSIIKMAKRMGYRRMAW